MANDYFDAGDYSALSRHTLGRAELANAIFSAIIAGFDKLPGESKLKRAKTTYAVDTGAANAYVVAPGGPASYEDGEEIVFKALVSNTGPSTVNRDALGTVPLKRADGTDLVTGDILAGQIVAARKLPAYFQLMNGHLVASPDAPVAAFILPFLLASDGPTARGAIGAAAQSDMTTAEADIDALEAVDTDQRLYKGTAGGSANNLTLTPAVALGAYAQGVRVEAKIASDNTDAATLNVSGLGAVTIKKVTRAGVVALTGYEMRAGMMARFAQPDAATFVLLNPADPAATGDLRMHHGPEATIPGGWFAVRGATFGNAGSGAAFAGEKYRGAFAWYYAYADAQCPVSGGRGASSDADFDAGKTITGRDMRGRAAYGKDTVAGSDAGRVTSGVSGVDGDTVGASGGDEREHGHVHTIAHTHDMGNHTHGISPTALQSAGLTVQTAVSAVLGGGSGANITQGPSTNTTGASSASDSGSFGAGSAQNLPPAEIAGVWVGKV